MTTKQMLEKIMESGCQKGMIHEYKIKDNSEDINKIGIKVDETIKSTEGKIIKIHDRIDAIKTMAIIQLISLSVALLLFLLNLISKGIKLL